LRWDQRQLAEASSVSLPTIKRLEAKPGILVAHAPDLDSHPKCHGSCRSSVHRGEWRRSGGTSALGPALRHKREWVSSKRAITLGTARRNDPAPASCCGGSALKSESYANHGVGAGPLFGSGTTAQHRRVRARYRDTLWTGSNDDAVVGRGSRRLHFSRGSRWVRSRALIAYDRQGTRWLQFSRGDRPSHDGRQTGRANERSNPASRDGHQFPPRAGTASPVSQLRAISAAGSMKPGRAQPVGEDYPTGLSRRWRSLQLNWSGRPRSIGVRIRSPPPRSRGCAARGRSGTPL
jgi:hypothetical protein